MGSKGMLAVIIAIVIFAVINIILVATGQFGDETWYNSLGIIVAAGLTLAIYSFLYEDNPLFKLAEHLYVGISLGYSIIQTYYGNLLPNLIDPLFRPEKGKYPAFLLLIPAFFGVLMLSRFVPKYAWLARWSIAFLVGMGAGMWIPRVTKSYVFIQARSAIAPLSAGAMFTGEGVEGFWGILGAWSVLLAFVGVLAVLIHFFFSVEHKGPVKYASRIGICFLMVAFGAQFGYTVMARMSLLIGRVGFLLKEWLHII